MMVVESVSSLKGKLVFTVMITLFPDICAVFISLLVGIPVRKRRAPPESVVLTVKGPGYTWTRDARSAVVWNAS